MENQHISFFIERTIQKNPINVLKPFFNIFEIVKKIILLLKSKRQINQIFNNDF